jgi:hypothetical protein
MTAEDHLERCKRHARAYLKRGRLSSAVCSIIANLGCHPETKPPEFLEELGIIYASNGDVEGVRRFIEGFR